MRLVAKFNLVFITVFSLGLLAAGFFSHSLLQRNARGEVIRNARIMMETAMAARTYTTQQIKPLLNDKLKHRFLPQTVPAYAATENFNYLRKEHPEYFYKEATLNPTNPRDRTTDWEADVVNQLRGDEKLKEIIGVRDTPQGPYLYLGRPIKITSHSCLSCHSTPDKAPPTQIKLYGTANGYGWKYNEIIGAQILSVPMSLPIQLANQAFKTFLGSLIAVFAFTLIALNVMLRLIVIQPVTRLSQVADEISNGNMEVEDLPVSGRDEISGLANSFQRMHRSLKQAMKMLED